MHYKNSQKKNKQQSRSRFLKFSDRFLDIELQSPLLEFLGISELIAFLLKNYVFALFKRNKNKAISVIWNLRCCECYIELLLVSWFSKLLLFFVHYLKLSTLDHQLNRVVMIVAFQMKQKVFNTAFLAPVTHQLPIKDLDVHPELQ